ncbi:alpha-hydroxy-acid oxidizing protein [Ancylobacter dichloromethanicus]|uniref:Alpha-hydroxy-acid oxidizing enzyme n=1 Tax=Ancylobacter dichloromethanicus TaxID=518825 RepID=A0A9W6J9Y4_9HYPH|nr:alpha-hydroxy acid oxidase [Ancylobacter dichloromethanicus]MBS7553503.1 alpha-hydroxy-acid oxidizing protein [Ancylobacter dichloromethanicus]GLK72561.1 alpha-hydroxy-acid oxidizing enzyme [Ancylobacter dichloromethanicus]
MSRDYVIPPGVVAAEDYEALARGRLSEAAFAYYAGGAGDETTLRWNREAFERVRLAPRVLASFTGGGTGQTLFGQSFAHPILVAPTAHHGLAVPEAEIATVVGAGGAKAGMVASTESDVTLEEIAGAARAPLWFQLYIQHDRGFTADLVRRAEAAGYGALVVTVDAPVHSLRNREQRAGYRGPKLSEHANLRGLHTSYIAEAALGESLMFRGFLDVAARWEDIAWLRSLTLLPILLKGIMTAEDAEIALAHGVDGLIVSNHGGRVLDTVPASLDALPAVVRQVAGRVPVLMDGGIRRGTDVLKALALGARAVLVGRPCLYALAVAGPAGVAHVLHLLRCEFEVAMVLTGCRTLADIGPQVIWRDDSGPDQ